MTEEGAVRGYVPYEKRKPEELLALVEDDVRALDAKNADAFKINARLFQAAQQIADDIDPTNREIRSLTPPEPASLIEDWRAAQAAADASET